MSATYEVHDGCTTLISDAAYAKLDEEQREKQAEILMWAVCAGVISIDLLVCVRLFHY